MKQRATIHIVDDDEAMRKSLSMLIKSIDMEPKTYDSAEEFLEKFTPSEPCCILLDVRMPGMSGLDLQKKLPQHNITSPVVVMTGYGDIPTAVDAMKGGAIDFIEKPFDHELLIRTLHNCLQSPVFPSPQIERQKYVRDLVVLTPREQEVFRLLVEGKINKVIAGELNLSVRTVEAHRANIMEKLAVHSLSDLVKISIYSNQAAH
ncbi:MAG: response regulator [Gammaproteobacteria bacterium]|nr:response regulator [Gammaproteobacteria bacterium]